MSELSIYTKTKGPLKGQKHIRLKGTNTDKTTKLTITNPELRGGDDEYRDEMVENPSDPFCLVRLHEELTRRYQEIEPGYSGRVFRRAKEKGGKLNKVVFNRPNMTSGGVFGKNQFTKMSKYIATRSGFNEPHKYTSSSWRRSGVTKMASNGLVPEAERMRAARHNCTTTHSKYQEMNEDTRALRCQAMLYNEADFGKFNLCFY